MLCNLFNKGSSLAKDLKKIGETSFRSMYHKIVYIKATPELKKILSEKLEASNKDDGFLAYGYIDDQAGFSFRVLCAASIKSRGKYNKEVGILIRKGQLNNCKYMNLDCCDIDTADFDEYISVINEVYKCKNEDTEKMREFTFLDEARNIDFPDDIKVFLIKKGLNPEQVWAKCWTFTENEYFAELLNEPNQDFGVHLGSIIGFTPVKSEEGILCVYTGRWLEEI